MVRRLNNLPEEIILEILTRLPTESVLDCKLVCKPWRDLVRHHPSFSQMHFNHHNGYADDDSGSKVSIIILSPDRQWLNELYYAEFDEKCDEILVSRKTRLNLSPEFHNCNFVGSCNGLACFSSLGDQHNYGPAFICNPITREYIILPDFQGVYNWNGFGYSASTNEYKVVRICFFLSAPNCEPAAQVYTVGGGDGWRNVGEMGMDWKNMKHFIQQAGVLANGALHWVNKDHGMILAFDLTNEKFSEFPSPSPPCLAQDGVPRYPIHLGVLGDFLCAISHRGVDCSEIWLLKKDTDSSESCWCKQCSVNRYVELLLSQFTKSGRILCYEGVGIYSFDPKASSEGTDVVGFGMVISGVIPHRNTLVSLKALGENNGIP